MADFDNHDNEFVLTDFIDDSVDSLSNPIPFSRGKFYAPLSAWIIAQSLDTFQDTRDILFGDAP